MDVIVERSTTKSFASALDWPGLSRAGATPEDAGAALLRYVPRYKKAIGALARNLKATEKIAIVEEQKGNSTTDFGAPDAIARVERDAMTTKELDRHMRILEACWRAFDAAAAAAKGATLATGPRGGTRWPARYAIRRSAWHALDHAWEIEDRVQR